MKKFLQTHVLFPKHLGFAPYFWLIFILPVFSVVAEVSGGIKYFWFGMVIFYIKLYRDTFRNDDRLGILLALQLVLDMVIAVSFDYIFLFIFTSFLIGSIPMGKHNFKRWLRIFYFSLSISLVWVLYSLFQTGVRVDVFDLALLILSPSLPILASRSLAEKQAQRMALQSENQRLRVLATERDRIAQALHDDLGQSFSLLALKAEVAQKFLQKDLTKTAEQLEQIANEARNDLDLVRQIVRDLKHETLLQTLHVASDNLKQAKITLLVENETRAMSFDQEVQQTIGAVLNEAVTNAIRYSEASFLKVIFDESPEKYHVIIKDDGVGFKAGKKEESFGLSGIKQRIQKLGGTCMFKNDNGAQIILTIPKKRG